MRKLALAVAVALLVPAGTADAGTSKADRCKPKGSKTVVKNRYARVYTAPGAGRGSVPDPAIKRRMEELGVRPVSETPEQFEALLVRERARNERYVAEIGLMPE